jgi:hypothetical protein
MVQHAEIMRLEEPTSAAYAEYLCNADIDTARCLQVDGPFLWSDGSVERAAAVRRGSTIAQRWADENSIHVPKGLIHDWIGVTCIPGATIENTLALVQNYDQHKQIYQPQVIDSKLISRRGNVFEVYLRLMKKKIITVVLDTHHHVEYVPITATRWWCRSHATRIAEIEDAGKATEVPLAPDTGYGFLWRLTSYWRFEQREDSVYVECRAISLTRDVPKGLGWAIEPIIAKLPRESLIATLESTRRSYNSGGGSTAMPPHEAP